MKLAYTGQMDKESFKDATPRIISALAKKDKNVVYLDADLMSCIGTQKWAKENPDRAFNCGIAEANMIGVACGLASVGFKPIVHTFGPFASRRVFDQLFLSAGYAGNDITVLGSDCGVTAAYNGGTHMPFEDVALLRSIPTATVIDVTDIVMYESVLKQCKDLPGVKYLRFPRKNNATVFPAGTETPIGKAITLREGKDLVIFCAGIMVHEALQAAAELSKVGIEAAVVNVFTIKPLDEKAVIKYAKQSGRVLVAENHNKIGGLYSAVCECLAKENCAKIDYVAVEDVYGQVGPQPFLQKEYGLTADHIVKVAKKLVK